MNACAQFAICIIIKPYTVLEWHYSRLAYANQCKVIAPQIAYRILNVSELWTDEPIAIGIGETVSEMVVFVASQYSEQGTKFNSRFM